MYESEMRNAQEFLQFPTPSNYNQMLKITYGYDYHITLQFGQNFFMIVFQVTYTYHYCTLDVYSIEIYNYSYPQHPLVMETWISALINEKYNQQPWYLSLSFVVHIKM